MSSPVVATAQGTWRVSWIGQLPHTKPQAWEVRAFLEDAGGRAVKTRQAFGHDASDALCRLESDILADPWCRRLEEGILLGAQPSGPYQWRRNIFDQLMHRVAVTSMEARRNPQHPMRRAAILARPPHQDELAGIGAPPWHQEAAIFAMVLEDILPPGSRWAIECPEWENLRISVTGIRLRPDAP